MKTIVKLSSLLAFGTAQFVEASDLIAYWSFDTFTDGLVLDEYGGNAGILLNGAQFTNDGSGHTGAAGDRAMLFGNGQHRMRIADASFLNAAGAANAISISYWQTLSQVRNQFAFLADSETQTRALALASPWGDSVVYWDTGGGFVDGVNRLTAVPAETWLSEWVHVVVTKSGDTKRIYVNGAEVTNGVNTAALPTDFTEFVIGNNTTSFNEALNGTLDDFAIFSRELTAQEVTDLFNGDSPLSLVGDNDTDGDGLPDAWELRLAGDLTTLAPGGDADSDSILDEDELAGGTNPTSNDSDGDGALDGEETNTGVWVSSSDRGTDPLNPDADSDGVLDGAETNTGIFVDANDTGTDPFSPDSDSDSIPDGVEITLSTDPTDSNSLPSGWVVRNDRSGVALNNIAQTRALFAGTSNIEQSLTIEADINFRDNANGPFPGARAFPLLGAQDIDANDHGLIANGTIFVEEPGVYTFGFNSDDGGGIFINGNPVIVDDRNRGSTTSLGAVFLPYGNHLIEFVYWERGGGAQCQLFVGSGPGDLTGTAFDIADYELLQTSFRPAEDSDDDGLEDGWETFFFGDLAEGPDGDFDSDGLTNLEELGANTDPSVDDTDGDGLLDGSEDGSGVFVSTTETGTNPLNADTDGDGLLDGVESGTGTFVSAAETGTDPNVADTDGDRWDDFSEVNWPSDPNDSESLPSIDPDNTSLLAFWDFNDNTDPDRSPDVVRGFLANFVGADTGFSDDGLGRTESPGDRAMNLGPNGGSNGAHVENARWFGLGIPQDQLINNLGSVGSSVDMAVGSGTLGATGAIAGDSDTALTTSESATRAVYDPALNIEGPWSAEVWLKPAVAMNAGQLTCAIANGDFANPRKGWLIYQSDSGWNFRTYYNDGLATAVNITGNNGAPPVAGEWNHLVATWDGTVGKLYVDGELRSTSIPQTYVPGIAGGFTLGARSDGPFQWAGDVDEVAFYGAELTAEQVKEHFDNAVNPARAEPYASVVLGDSPLAYWRMTSDDPVPGPDQVAVSFWQKLDSTSNSSAFWASSTSSGNNVRGFQAHNPWSDGNYYFDTGGTAADTQRLSGPSDVIAGEWNHFVYQKSGSRKEVWKDGVLVLSGDLAAPLADDFFRLTIGAEYRAGDTAHNATRGLIDDFAVFGSFLSEEEILRLAEGESPTTISGPATPLTITSIEIGETAIVLTWNSRANQNYSLETNLDLGGAWTEVTDGIESQGDETTYILPLSFIPDAGSKRFFRVFEE